MSNKDNKLTDTLDKLDHIIKQLRERAESQNTKANDSLSDYECHEGYRHRLLDKLHNLCQGDLFVRDYRARFEDLTRRCEVIKHCSLTIIRFVSSLRSDIRRAMNTSSYCVDYIEDAFGFALKIDLTFKGIVSARVWEQCFKCEGYEHYDYQCLSESLQVNFVLSDDVDDLNVIKDFHIHSEIFSVVEDPLVTPSTLIIDDSHVSSASTSDVVDASVDSSTPIPDEIYIHEEIKRVKKQRLNLFLSFLLLISH